MEPLGQEPRGAPLCTPLNTDGLVKGAPFVGLKLYVFKFILTLCQVKLLRKRMRCHALQRALLFRISLHVSIVLSICVVFC